MAPTPGYIYDVKQSSRLASLSLCWVNSSPLSSFYIYIFNTRVYPACSKTIHFLSITHIYLHLIRIIGDTNSFGGNKKENAVRLYTTPQSYPVWTSLEPFIVNSNKPLTYRYGIVEQGVCTSMETSLQRNVDNGNNSAIRKLKNRTLVAKGYDLVIEDIFEYPEASASYDELELIAESKGMVATKSQDFQTTINQLTSDSRSLYLVCFHLPLVVKRSASGTKNEFDISWAESLIAKTSGSVSEGMKTWWVGTIGVPGEPLTEDETKALKDQLYSMSCIAIFLDSKMHHDTYKGYCKQIMW